MADNTFDAYFDPDSAAVVQGCIVPGENVLNAAIDRLKADLADTVNFPDLKNQWTSDPHKVLADRGFFSDLRETIIANSDIAVPQDCQFLSTFQSACCQGSIL